MAKQPVGIGKLSKEKQKASTKATTEKKKAKPIEKLALEEKKPPEIVPFKPKEKTSRQEKLHQTAKQIMTQAMTKAADATEAPELVDTTLVLTEKVVMKPVTPTPAHVSPVRPSTGGKISFDEAVQAVNQAEAANDLSSVLAKDFEQFLKK